MEETNDASEMSEAYRAGAVAGYEHAMITMLNALYYRASERPELASVIDTWADELAEMYSLADEHRAWLEFGWDGVERSPMLAETWDPEAFPRSHGLPKPYWASVNGLGYGDSNRVEEQPLMALLQILADRESGGDGQPLAETRADARRERTDSFRDWLTSLTWRRTGESIGEAVRRAAKHDLGA